MRPVSPSGPQQYPVGPPVMPHRKNAAEWVMWAALRPVAWLVRAWGVCAGGRGGSPGGA